MANRKALGRGLQALIPDAPPAESPEQQQAPAESTSTSNIRFIAVSKVSPNPFQPRETFDPVKLEELQNSISEKGVVQPITVRPYDGAYQLIAGERRLRAVTGLGIEEIPAYILEIDSDEEMMELSIIENIHREDLNPIDIAHSYQRLIKECNLTQEVVAQKVGKDRATVANFLRLLKLPKLIQESARSGDLSMGHAKALLALNDKEDQLAIWKKILNEGLSVRNTEKMARDAANPIKKEKKTAPTKKDYYLEEMENKLRIKLATKVNIKPRAKGGVIELEYYDSDDLDRLVNVINED